MILRRTGLFRLRWAANLAAGACSIACLGMGCLDAQEVRVEVAGDADPQVELALGAPMQGIAARSETAQRWVRGFIQNEFNNIERVCKPSAADAQALVNVAELEWKNRLSNTIRAYSETQNQRIPADFESRVERLVQIWVRDALPEELYNRWQQEIDARLSYRKRIVIGRMVGDCERKYGLTHSQMVEVEQVVQERWKDSWWSMYRTGTLPETKFAWISKSLSESQRTAGTDRASQITEHFMSGGFVDMPTLDLNQRFKVGPVTSSADIPMDKSESGKAVDQNMATPKETDPNMVGPDKDSR